VLLERPHHRPVFAVDVQGGYQQMNLVQVADHRPVRLVEEPDFTAQVGGDRVLQVGDLQREQHVPVLDRPRLGGQADALGELGRGAVLDGGGVQDDHATAARLKRVEFSVENIKNMLA